MRSSPMTRAEARADTNAATNAESADFADFYTATFHRVAAQLHAYLGDHAEAQDLTQEAFCRALDRWGRVSRYENPAAWVRQVAWNLATSRLRHLQVARRFLALQRDEHAPPPGPERVDLIRALAALPANHRLAVVLHHVGQLSTSEIAAQRGVAEGTVRSWLSRGRAQLAEQLVDWGQVVAVPPEGGVEAAVAKVKRRRTTRRATLAAVLAFLLAVPLAVLVLGKPSEPPIIVPTPQPSISPTPAPSPSLAAQALETRRIVLPDAQATFGNIIFVDRDHAWWWHSPCEQISGAPVQRCEMLAVSADGARTWRRIELPPIPADSRTHFLPVDAVTASIQVTERYEDRPKNYWHTTDAGATFKSYPVGSPPAETVISSQRGRYAMLCPGATGLEDGAWGISCDRPQLVRIGVGPVNNSRLPVRTAAMVVQEGTDGRLWLTADAPHPRLWVSGDTGRSWKELPYPAEAHGYFILSPDGKQQWIIAQESMTRTMWELADAKWVKRFTASGSFTILLNAGVWLVDHDGSVAYLHDGSYTVIPGLPVPDGGYVLRDGTILLTSGGEIFLGHGEGTQRQWVRLMR